MASQISMTKSMWMDRIEIVQMHDLLGISLSDYAASVTDHLPVVAEFNTDIDND